MNWDKAKSLADSLSFRHGHKFIPIPVQSFRDYGDYEIRYEVIALSAWDKNFHRMAI